MGKKKCQGCGKEVLSSNWSRHVEEKHKGKPQDFTYVKEKGTFLTWMLVGGTCCIFLAILSFLTIVCGIGAYYYLPQHWPSFTLVSSLDKLSQETADLLKDVEDVTDKSFHEIFPGDYFDKRSLFNYSVEEIKTGYVSNYKKKDQIFSSITQSCKDLKKVISSVSSKCRLAQLPGDRAVGPAACSSDDLKTQINAAIKEELSHSSDYAKLAIKPGVLKSVFDGTNFEDFVEALFKDIMNKLNQVAYSVEAKAVQSFNNPMISHHDFIPYSPYLLRKELEQLARQSQQRAVTAMRAIYNQAKEFYTDAFHKIRTCKLAANAPAGVARCTVDDLRPQLILSCDTNYHEFPTAKVVRP